jgi:hypothetical protein
VPFDYLALILHDAASGTTRLHVLETTEPRPDQWFPPLPAEDTNGTSLSATSESDLDPREFAVLLGSKHVLIYKYIQGTHLPRLQDLPEIAQALNLKSCRDLIPQEWCSPGVEKRHPV